MSKIDWDMLDLLQTRDGREVVDVLFHESQERCGSVFVTIRDDDGNYDAVTVDGDTGMCVLGKRTDHPLDIIFKPRETWALFWESEFRGIRSLCFTSKSEAKEWALKSLTGIRPLLIQKIEFPEADNAKD